jgi:hypothetical protein
LAPAPASQLGHPPGSFSHWKIAMVRASSSSSWAMNSIAPEQVLHRGHSNPAGASGVPPIRLVAEPGGTAPA